MSAFEIAAIAAAWWVSGFVLMAAGQLIFERFDNRPGQIAVYPRDLILCATIGLAGPLIFVMLPVLVLFVLGDRIADRIIGKGNSGTSIRLWPRAKPGGGA